MNDWDKPEYQEMIGHLEKASPRNSRKYSGYGLDLSDIDLNYLYENVWGLLEALCTVARAADKLVHHTKGQVEEAEAEILIDVALDALPAWVLEEEA